MLRYLIRLIYLFYAVKAQVETSTVSPESSTDEASEDLAILPRDKWNVEWYRSNAPLAPLRRVTFNVGSGQRLDKSSYKDLDHLNAREWRLGYEYKDTVRRSRLIGYPAILGDSGEGSRYALRSAEGMEAILEEQLFPEVFCRGAKHKRWFFGTQFYSTELNEANNRCVKQCFAIAGEETQYNISRSKISNSPTMRDCRVPITHLVRAPLVKIAVSDGPRASIELPRSLWYHSGIERRTDLVNTLVHLRFAPCPPNELLATPADVLELIVSPQGVDNTTPTSTVGMQTSAESLTPSAAESSPLSSSDQDAPPLLVLSRSPSKRLPWEIDSFNFTSFDFFPDDSQQGPLVLAAPAVHYGSLAASSFNGATVTGYFQEQAPVLGLYGSGGEAVIDIYPVIKRIYDADRLEIALQSNCGILSISPEIVFRKAIAWIYHIDEDRAQCSRSNNCSDCISTSCTWCRKMSKATDFYDREWAQISGISRWGRCGMPADACIYDEGEHVQNASSC